MALLCIKVGSSVKKGGGRVGRRDNFYFRCEFAVLMKHPHEVNRLSHINQQVRGSEGNCGVDSYVSMYLKSNR